MTGPTYNQADRERAIGRLILALVECETAFIFSLAESLGKPDVKRHPSAVSQANQYQAAHPPHRTNGG